PGDQLLTSAGFARQQDGALRLRDELRPRDDVPDLAAAADDAVMIELGIALAEEIAQPGAGSLIFEGAPRQHEQLVHFERFLEIVARAEFHRLDRPFYAAIV